MDLSTVVLICIAASPFLLALILVVPAVMRSSQITRQEEKESGKLL